jgi:multidrug efflux pump subunit AcrA (membrane-fusion protein)
MTNPHADLQALTVRRAPGGTHPAIRPPRRWLSRVGLPLLLLGGFAGLVAWASWGVLVPAAPVTVTPVVARTGIIQTRGVELFSATGWIEPRPTPLEVPALAEGVVEELLVLPGQRVRAGEVVARLIDADARLALQSAQDELAERQLKVQAAQADLSEAQAMLRAADANVKADEELYRNQVIGLARYEQTVAQQAVAQARVAQARIRVKEAEARVRQGETAVRIAELRLERMNVRAPVNGVVMSLNAIPGRMVGTRNPTSGQPDSIVTLYNPDELQVRVEVPIDKFQLVRPGQPALIEVDVVPGERLPGVVLYDTHETDIQRNTVRVKVGLLPAADRACPWPCPLPALAHLAAQGVIEALLTARQQVTAPQHKLRPGMIAKVRVLAPPTAGDEEKGGEVLRILVPKRLIVSAEGQSAVWIVDQAAHRAVLRPVVLGPAQQGELVEVVQGLQPSDKLISGGREGLQPGQRVRITGEEL